MVYIFQLFLPHQNPVCITSHTRATRPASSIMHHFNILKIKMFSLCILLRPPVTSSLSNLSLISCSPRSPLSTSKQPAQTYKTSEITFQYILILMFLDCKQKTKNMIRALASVPHILSAIILFMHAISSCSRHS